MKRELDNFLIQWAKKKHRKPLLLRGARQTGKSYAVEKMAKSFPNFVCINFEKNPSLGKLFVQDLDPQRIIREIEAIFEKQISPGKILLFFDEIQNCPSAVTALRYFYEETPDLHVVGAGSLLEFEIDKISVPVGRLEFVYVRPFTFFEYLRALGKEILATQIAGYNFPNQPSDLIHNNILGLLRDYLFIGGMPGVLKRFIDDNSYLSAAEEQEDILSTYRADFNRYSGRAGTDHITRIFESTPKIIGNKVTYAKIDPDAKAQQLKRAINLLEKAHLLKKVKATSGAGVPLAAGASEKRYKLVFLDVGLMQRLMGVRYRDWRENNNLFSTHTGAVAEQFVGQELIGLKGLGKNSDLYYWDRTARGSTAEIDYLVAFGGHVVPIEVKSSAFGHLKSLHLFLKKYPSAPLGLKISEQNFALKDNIAAIPLYSVLQLQELYRQLKSEISIN
jgi:predicted AAA+ superfamily ATPase